MEYPRYKACINTSDDNVVEELYRPALMWATRFDRGVGYFTSGWLTVNLEGLSDFASRGGKIRLITSPILSNADLDAIILANEGDGQAFQKLEEALLRNVDALQLEMGKDILNTFSWLIYDEIIDLRFAVPCKSLRDGNFHDKFGIFYKDEDALSFSGSINDSIHGFQNYESIKVFSTWSGTRDYVRADIDRFNRLWDGKDSNLKMYSIPHAIKNRIFKLRFADRPYSLMRKAKNKWEHQDIAVSSFMEKEHGILAMATGTGKTITAMKIIDQLFEERKIKRVIITMFGTDLLDQWAKQLREHYPEKQIYYHYESKKMTTTFIMHPDNALLLISRDADNLTKLLNLLDKLPGNYKDDTLFVFDEVHGAGSNSFVKALSGRISPYRYRLGLSATPEREYDETGNDFIKDEIGEIIFEFSLKDAIRKGILCEFNYIPLPYVLSDEERDKKRRIIATFNAKKKNGEVVNDTDMYTELARVNKTALNKIEEFEKLVSKRRELLSKSIIFVYEREYGELLQEVLIKYTDRYHTYYAEDEKSNLEKFANGEISCLVTCKKVSEGIDISCVSNIFLFSSDRSRLVTTQRIGRALRLDKNNPDKVANVIDFILNDGDKENDSDADHERNEWLTELSETRRIDDEE